MICPWLIDTVTETNNRNSYNDSRRAEKHTFGKCVGSECPFYIPKIINGMGDVKQQAGCKRANLTK